MNYIEEINKMLSTVQEPVLRFFYSFLRAITTDPEGASIIEYLTHLFSSE